MTGRGGAPTGEDAERLHDGRRDSAGASQERAPSYNPQTPGAGSTGAGMGGR